MRGVSMTGPHIRREPMRAVSSQRQDPPSVQDPTGEATPHAQAPTVCLGPRDAWEIPPCLGGTPSSGPLLGWPRSVGAKALLPLASPGWAWREWGTGRGPTEGPTGKGRGLLVCRGLAIGPQGGPHTAFVP